MDADLSSEYEEEEYGDSSEADSSFDEDQDNDSEDGYSDEPDDIELQNKLATLLRNTISKSDNRTYRVPPLPTNPAEGSVIPGKKSSRSMNRTPRNKGNSSQKNSLSEDTVQIDITESNLVSPRSKLISSRGINKSFPLWSLPSPSSSLPSQTVLMIQDPPKRSPRSSPRVQISLPDNSEQEQKQSMGPLSQRRRSRTNEATALRRTFGDLQNQINTEVNNKQIGGDPSPAPKISQEKLPSPRPVAPVVTAIRADEQKNTDSNNDTNDGGVTSRPPLRKTHSHSELTDTFAFLTSLHTSAPDPPTKTKTQSYINLNDKKKGKKWTNRRGMWKLKKDQATISSYDETMLSNTNEENLTRGLCARDTLLLNDLFLVWGIPPMSTNCQDRFLSLLQKMTIEEEMRAGGLSTPPSAVAQHNSQRLADSHDLLTPESGYLIEEYSSSLAPQITFMLDQNYYRQQFLGQRQWVFVAYENQKTPLLFSVLKTVEGNSFKTFKASPKGFEVISIPRARGISSKGQSRGVIEWITKNHNCHPVKIKDSRIHSHLANLEESDPQKLKCVTFGVVTVQEDQNEENTIFSNELMSPANQEFLNCLGDTIKLEGWTDFSGGLDVKGNTKGTHSIFTEWRGIKIMFHVATLLPFSPSDAQQIERKNMIGNDIVIIVFKEGSQPYVPSTIRSHMNHIIVVVSPERDPTTGFVTRYRLGCARRDTVPEFGPEIPVYVEKGPAFREILLAKIMNGLKNSRSSGAFSRLFSLPRTEVLCQLIDHYTSASKGRFLLFKPCDTSNSKHTSRIF